MGAGWETGHSYRGIYNTNRIVFGMNVFSALYILFVLLFFGRYLKIIFLVFKV